MSRTRPQTAAIVLNWNGWRFTAGCLRDLAESDPPLDVIAVDNGSTDGSADLLQAQQGPGITVIRLPRNMGFAAGMNAGIRAAADAGYEFVWLLNNDVSIPPDAHRRLLGALTGAPAETVVTPALFSPSGAVQHAGGTYRPDGSAQRLMTPDALATAPPADAWLTATALFCRTATALRVGPFDERFFAYWEDVDWSRRATGTGVRLAVATDVAITHHNGQGAGAYGSPLAAFLMARNELLFVARHVTGRRRRAARLKIVARQLRWALLLDRRGQPEQARAVVGGVAAGLLRRSGRPRRVAAPRLLMRAVLARPLTTARRLDAWAARVADGGQPPVDPSASTASSPAVDAAARRSGSTSPPAGASD